MPEKQYPAPRDLETRGKRLWRDVMAEFTLRPDERSTLHELCRCLDMIDKVEADLRGAPLTLPGSTGQPRANPLLTELRGHRAVAAQLTRLLALNDVPDTAEDGTAVPTPRQIRSRRAAQARWGHGGA